MASWIDKFLDITDDVETPRQWLYWSALATISAVVAPNVEIAKAGKYKYYKVRPNLYILLMGESGLGKGFGISVSKKLVKAVGNTRVIFGRGSIEGIITELAVVKSKENGHIPYKDARGFVVSSEFAASLVNSDYGLGILTDLYDAHYNEDWENTLKGTGVDKLRFPCITLLSGSNQDMFESAVTKHHFQGGFIARTQMITADKRHKANALSNTGGEDFPIDELAKWLIEISKVSGEFKYSSDGKAEYDSWFYPYRNSANEDKTGTVNRLNDSILKIAMCISLANKTDLVLEKYDIEEAIAITSGLEKAAKQVTLGQGESSLASFMKVFLSIIINEPNYTIHRTKLLKKAYGRMSAEELDKVVDTLQQSKFITISNNSYIARADLIENWKVRQGIK